MIVLFEMSRNIAPLESGTETDTATETGDETLSESHEMQAMIHLPGKFFEDQPNPTLFMFSERVDNVFSMQSQIVK